MDNNAHNNPLFIAQIGEKVEELKTPPLTRRESGVPPIATRPPVWEGIHNVDTVQPVAAEISARKRFRMILDNQLRDHRRADVTGNASELEIPNRTGVHAVDHKTMWNPNEPYRSVAQAVGGGRSNQRTKGAPHPMQDDVTLGEQQRREVSDMPPVRVQLSTGSLIVSVIAILFVIGLVLE